MAVGVGGSVGVGGGSVAVGVGESVEVGVGGSVAVGGKSVGVGVGGSGQNWVKSLSRESESLSTILHESGEKLQPKALGVTL